MTFDDRTQTAFHRTAINHTTRRIVDYVDSLLTKFVEVGREPWSSGYGRKLMFLVSWVRIPAQYTLTYSDSSYLLEWMGGQSGAYISWPVASPVLPMVI